MEKRKIIDALGRSADCEPQQTEFCLQPEQLAAWMDGGLRESDRNLAGEHLSNCDFCLDQLATLLHSAKETKLASLSDEVIQQAERMAAPPVRHSGAYLGWAAAAVVVLAVGMVSTQWRAAAPTTDGEPVTQTRYADQAALEPRLLAPSDGSVIQPLEQVFRWTAVPGTLFYDVRLVSSDGNLMLEERVEDTRWLIPQGLALHAGEEYYVRVDAYLSDSKYLSSEHVLFTVGRTP